jgi:hypothetical protein
MADLDVNETDEVTVADAAGVNKLTVNADGSINAIASNYSLVKNQKSFGCNVEQNVASTGEQNVLLVRNPSGSGKSMFINIFECAVLGSATRYRVRLYQKPTVTAAGTSTGTFSNTVTSAPTAAVGLIYVLPTTSARGTRMSTYSQEGVSSIFEKFDYGIDLMPGYDLLITADFDATNKVLGINLQWSEE